MPKHNNPVSPSNPSKKAIARVLNPLPVPVACPFCQGEVKVVSNKAIYGKAIGHWPWVYLCMDNACHSYVGLHPYTHIPLGTLADIETREARKLAKALFQQRWGIDGDGTSRTAAYSWLAHKLNIPVGECHFGWFDVQACHSAYTILKDSLGESHACAN